MNRWDNSLRAITGIGSLVFALQSGCCTPVVVSHRMVEAPSTDECNVEDEFEAESQCDCRSAIGHFFHYAARPHRLLPGSDHDGRGMLAYGRSVNVAAPHSKFHPVPTRPVFAPRYSEFDLANGLPQADEEALLAPVPEPELEAPSPPPDLAPATPDD